MHPNPLPTLVITERSRVRHGTDLMKPGAWRWTLYVNGVGTHGLYFDPSVPRMPVLDGDEFT